ncbi:MAG: hypothetical protein CVV23_10525 [Ignavibacteriae bacterium HGW-Ignavibacteriae-2]|nr:hypothetical protein [Bacteroidota bacterium]PKL88381.1 MAG: hypothetical protein CVV23_10525 [Ignavibacteriae bacterium HGW-Ignavibacteriae-2]
MIKNIFYILLLFCITLTAQENHKNIYELKSRLIKPVFLQEDEAQLQTSSGKKKSGVAILYSILLPGMGELYAGDYSLGQYFTAADGVLWAALFGFNIYGNNMMDNYKGFAVSTGGANVKGKNDKYFADLGNYLDIDQYNRLKELDRNFSEVYYSDSYYWKWADQAERKEYRKMWKSSENAFNNVRFAAGALILNRIVSAINAVRLVSRHNRNIAEETSWNLNFGLDKKEFMPTEMVMNLKFGF